MHRLLHALIAVMLLCCSVVHAAMPTRADEYVNDFAQLLSPQSRAALRERLAAVERATDVEIVVATIDSMDRYGLYGGWEGFATALFDKWGVGNQPANRGVLLLVSRSDRKVRIELGAGYGRHFDPIMKRIVDETLVPNLKAGAWETAVREGTEAIIASTTNRYALHDQQILKALAALGVLSLLIGVYARLTGRTGLAWVFFGIAGLTALALLVLIGRCLGHDGPEACTTTSDQGNAGSPGNGYGTGGGTSGGGGASGSF
jgi:uncharacterized protein